MPALGALEAAKKLCRLSDWSLSNLEVQKILYIAQLRYFRAHPTRRLVDTSFQAWDYGPVSQIIYHRLKAFGSRPVTRSIFIDIRTPVNSRDGDLEDTYTRLNGVTSTQLVALTHRDGGAWAEYYDPDVRGMVIPDGAIVNESRQFPRP